MRPNATGGQFVLRITYVRVLASPGTQGRGAGRGGVSVKAQMYLKHSQEKDRKGLVVSW